MIYKWFAPGADIVVGEFETDKLEVFVEYMVDNWILGTKTFSWTDPIELNHDHNTIQAYMGAFGMLGNVSRTKHLLYRHMYSFLSLQDCFSNFVWGADWKLNEEKKIVKLHHTYIIKAQCPQEEKKSKGKKGKKGKSEL